MYTHLLDHGFEIQSPAQHEFANPGTLGLACFTVCSTPKNSGSAAADGSCHLTPEDVPEVGFTLPVLLDLCTRRRFKNMLPATDPRSQLPLLFLGMSLLLVPNLCSSVFVVSAQPRFPLWAYHRDGLPAHRLSPPRTLVLRGAAYGTLPRQDVRTSLYD